MDGAVADALVAHGIKRVNDRLRRGPNVCSGQHLCYALEWET